MEQGAGEFAVTDGQSLQKALAQNNFGLDDLASPRAARAALKTMQGLPALASGTLRTRVVGRVVNLQCRLLQTGSEVLAGSGRGSALLNESEWAMLGKSAALSPKTAARPPPSLDDVPARDPQRPSWRNWSKVEWPASDVLAQFRVPGPDHDRGARSVAASSAAMTGSSPCARARRSRSSSRTVRATRCACGSWSTG